MKSVVTRNNIWSFAQNRPTLVVCDLANYVEADVVYRVLLARGVFKWLAARRELIRTKDAWKERVTATIAELSEAKRTGNGARVQWLRGYLKAMEECRHDIRAICHGERWQAPDNDRHAMAWLHELEDGTQDGLREMAEDRG